MKQYGLFDDSIAYDRLDKCLDPLLRLNEVVNWELFRAQLQSIRKNETVGRPSFDVVMMFKIMILQSLYNISDDAMEFFIRDRLSFMRFLSLDLTERVPDAKTIWKFREELTKAELIKPLFAQFDEYLAANGFEAKGGQLIDATIVEVPIQHNTKEERKQIENGETPVEWNKSKTSQKDTDARWTKKNSKSFFGYKDHVNVDEDNKIIRDYDVSPANTHDSQKLEEIVTVGGNMEKPSEATDTTKSEDIPEAPPKPKVYADKAYDSKNIDEFLSRAGLEPQICRKAKRGTPLSEGQKEENRKRSKIRTRVEHVFGAMYQKAHDLTIRTIGLSHAAAKIGLRNIAYNMMRFCYLSRAKAA
jgi:IS5 family transposase